MSITAAINPSPVYRDGLTSELSYVFLAVKESDQYNAVVWCPERRKLKFYPNSDFWGLTQAILGTLNIDAHLYNREDYQGLNGMPRAKVAEVLDYVRGQRGTTVVNTQVFLHQSFSGDRGGSRSLHPRTSRVPFLG